MTTADATRPLSRTVTMLLAGVATILAFMFDLLQLPVETLVPWAGMAALAGLGLLLAWRGGGLAATLAGILGGIGLSLVLSAVAHRAFGQVPWLMHVDRFAGFLALTVAIALAAATAGHLLGWMLHGRPAIRPAPARIIGGLLGGAVAVVLGGALLAEATETVIPGRAVEPVITLRADAVTIDPSRFAEAPAFFTIDNRELPASGDPREPGLIIVILPVASDADVERRAGGDLSDRDALATRMIVPATGSSSLHRASFRPGRYVLVVAEPEPPSAEGRPDVWPTPLPGLHAEFEVTD